MKCIICGKELPNEWVDDSNGFKHNSLPLISKKKLNKTEEMTHNPNCVCCSDCNSNYVIPIRMMVNQSGLEKTKSKLKVWLKSNKLNII